MERGFVAGFERKVLFRIARFVAFSICFLLFLSLVAGGAYLILGSQDHIARPDPAEVVQSLKPAESPTSDQNQSENESAPAPQLNASALGGVKIPPVLQEILLTEQNQQVFKGWLDNLPLDERQPFLDGMAKAVTEGRKQSLDDVSIINSFHERYASYVSQKQAAEELAKTQRLYVAGAIVSTLMLLALFSLVLVLLAIERNTREPERGAA